MSLPIAAVVLLLLLFALAFALKKSAEIDVQAVFLDGGRSSQRREHMTRVTSSWERWPSTEVWAELTGSCITELRRGRFFGPMTIQIDSGSLKLFDWQVTMPSQGQPGIQFQTLAVFTPVELKAPGFFVQPTDTRLPIERANSLNSYQRFQTGTDLDFTHNCQSCFEDLVVKLFQSDLGRQKIETIVSRGWTVEWTGRQLIVFRVGHLVPPNELRAYALEVMEFASLLCNGQAAVHKMLDQRIEAFFDQAC